MSLVFIIVLQQLHILCCTSSRQTIRLRTHSIRSNTVLYEKIIRILSIPLFAYYRLLNKSEYQYSSDYLSIKTHAVAAEKNRLNETVLFSTQNKS